MNMQARLRTIFCTGLCTGIALATSACIARGPDDYRTVTRGLVDTKKSDIEGCFGDTKGKIVIDFTVEKKTGKITNPVVNEKGSTPAEAEAGMCVAGKIDGLGIDQPDMRDGAATFTWVYNK
jgi:hypothetical protein